MQGILKAEICRERTVLAPPTQRKPMGSARNQRIAAEAAPKKEKAEQPAKPAEEQAAGESKETPRREGEGQRRRRSRGRGSRSGSAGKPQTAEQNGSSPSPAAVPSREEAEKQPCRPRRSRGGRRGRRSGSGTPSASEA